MVVVKWTELKPEDIHPMHKTQQFPYETLNDALDGLSDLVLIHTKLKDNVERWYKVEPYTSLNI